MSWWRVVSSIVWKDVVVEWRAKGLLLTMFAVGLLVILMFDVAFRARVSNASDMMPGTLWAAFALSGMLGLSRSFELEKARGSLDGLLLGPVSRSAIYLAKWLSNWLFISLIAAAVLPLASGLCHVNLMRGDLLLITILSAGGYAGVGTLYSAIVANTRARGILLPLLLLPVTVPLLLATVEVLGGLLEGENLALVTHWLWILVGFVLISVILGCVLFDHVVEE
jgi:heme exporter protein B